VNHTHFSEFHKAELQDLKRISFGISPAIPKPAPQFNPSSL
jgi:hypothetical protein